MWQPIGVVVASAITYGTVPKYRCPTTTPALPACSTVARGEPCCSASSNFGWRLDCGILGFITLFVFVCRFFLFNFQESPKYLIGRGKEEEAIEVLHKIAKYNKCAPPELTMEHFAAIDQKMGLAPVAGRGGEGQLTMMQTTKRVVSEGGKRISHLRGLFNTPVSLSLRKYFGPLDRLHRRLLVVQHRRFLLAHHSTTTKPFQRRFRYRNLPSIRIHLPPWCHRYVNINLPSCFNTSH
jgi:hypothetical protein